MTSLVTVEHRPGYALVGLNRPEKKNALNRAARRELLAALTSLRAECRAIVLTGCGDSFCSGVDLKEARADAEAATAPDPGSDWIEVLIAIREHPAVFIAAVNGLALGGGATLVSVCANALTIFARRSASSIKAASGSERLTIPQLSAVRPSIRWAVNTSQAARLAVSWIWAPGPENCG
jgi:1,4-dihydroxy-2-naphthoyl-CoA synthase